MQRTVRTSRTQKLTLCAVFAQLAVLAVAQSSSASLRDLKWSGGRVIAPQPTKVYAVEWDRTWLGIGPSPGPDRFSDTSPSGTLYTETSVRNYINFFLKNVGGPYGNNNPGLLNALSQYCDKPSNFLKTDCGPTPRPGANLIKNRPNLLTDERIWIDATSPAPWRGMRETAVLDEARRAVAHFRQTGQYTDSDADKAIFIIFTPPGKSPRGFGDPLTGNNGCVIGFPGAPWHPGFRKLFAFPYNPEIARCGRRSVNNEDDDFGHGWLDGYSIWMGRVLASAITNPELDGWAYWSFSDRTYGYFDRHTRAIDEACEGIRPSQNVSIGRPPNNRQMAVAPLWSNQDSQWLRPATGCVFESRAQASVRPWTGVRAFGSVPLGRESPPVTFTLSHFNGYNGWTDSRVEIHTDGPDRDHPNDRSTKSEGAAASDFIVDSSDCDNKTLTMEPQNNSCKVKVTFRPQAVGKREAHLRFYNDSEGFAQVPTLESSWSWPPPFSPERHLIDLRGYGLPQPARRGHPDRLASAGGNVADDSRFFVDYWSPDWDEDDGFEVTSPSGTRYTSQQLMTYNRRFFERIGASGFLDETTPYCKGNIGTDFTFCSDVPAGSRTMIANPANMHSSAEGLCNRSARCWVDTATNTDQQRDREPSPGMPLSRIEAEARRAASHFGNPGPANAIYVIYTPPGKAPRGFGEPTSDPLCAMHGSAGGGPPYYIYLPFVPEYPACSRRQGPDDPFGHGYLDSYSFWAAAMAANTITDPTGPTPPSGVRAGWRDQNGYEIATKCVNDFNPGGERQPFGPYTFTVPRLWSNAASSDGGACVFESQANAELRPAEEIDLGEVPVTARASRTRTITLENKGPVELRISRVERQGASDFTLENDRCTGSALQALPQRNTCMVTVRYRPTGPLGRLETAGVKFQSDRRPDTEATIESTYLSAKPVSPIEVKQAGLAFGQQTVGGQSAPQRIEIENVGDESVTLHQPVLAGEDRNDFRITANNCGTLDPERRQCAVAVAFAPGEREDEEEDEDDVARKGWRSAGLKIASSADPEGEEVRLWGKADEPVTARPRTTDFGEWRLRVLSSTKWIQVKNNSGSELEVTGAWIFSGHLADFSANYQFCTSSFLGGPIAPGGSCNVSVNFNPTALGQREATVRVAYTVGGREGFVTARVRGSGIGETWVPGDPLVPELIGPLPSDPLYLEFSPWG